MSKYIKTTFFLCFFSTTLCFAQDQLKMMGKDSSEVVIGTKIDINAKHKEVFDELRSLKVGDKPSRVYITIPFATNGFGQLFSHLIECAQWGHSVSIVLKTSILRNTKNKEIVDKAVLQGSLSIYNSNQLHAKDFLVVQNTLDLEDSFKGVFISGSANAGSDAGINRNQEAYVVLKNSTALASAEKIFKSYIEMANYYDGLVVLYTPEKKKQRREQLLKERAVRSASDLANLHVTSTVDTNVAKSREAMVTDPDVVGVIVETMTGYPEYVEKVTETVPVRLFVDKEAIVSHGERYEELAKKPNVTILVHMGSGTKHAKTVCVRKKTKTVLDLSSTNNSLTSYGQYNTHVTMEIDTDSPYKQSLDKQKQQAQSSPESSPVVLFDPNSPNGGKRIRMFKEQRAAASERKNDKRSAKRKLFECGDDSPNKKRGIETVLGAIQPVHLYAQSLAGTVHGVDVPSSASSTSTTTIANAQHVKRRLVFDAD